MLVHKVLQFRTGANWLRYTLWDPLHARYSCLFCNSSPPLLMKALSSTLYLVTVHALSVWLWYVFRIVIFYLPCRGDVINFWLASFCTPHRLCCGAWRPSLPPNSVLSIIVRVIIITVVCLSNPSCDDQLVSMFMNGRSNFYETQTMWWTSEIALSSQVKVP